MPAKKKGSKKDSRLARAGVSGYNKPKGLQVTLRNHISWLPKKVAR